MSEMTDIDLAAIRAGMKSIPEIEERPIGRIRVWGASGILLLERRIENGDRLPDVEHMAVGAARDLASAEPRHVTVDVGNQRTVKVVDGSFLRDPREFLRAVEWPSNSLLDPETGRVEEMGNES